MKKLFLLGLVSLGIVGLSGCDMINKYVDVEMPYTYESFLDLMADRDFSQSFVSCEVTHTTSGDTENTSTTTVYNYDATTDKWMNENGSSYMSNITVKDDLKIYVQLFGKDDIKCYASNSSYKIEGKMQEERHQTVINGQTYVSNAYIFESVSKYEAHGLVSSATTTYKDLDEGTVTKNTYTYTYKQLMFS